MFGYGKVRYRGLSKNTERLTLLLGLSNLMTVDLLGFLKPERWCRTRHLPEQKFRSLSRHTQKVRPQVQQETVFFIIVTPCNAKAWSYPNRRC